MKINGFVLIQIGSLAIPLHVFLALPVIKEALQEDRSELKRPSARYK